VAQLRQHETELSRLNVGVLLISFGTAVWARRWLEETGSTFPLLLDPPRHVYRLYGLEVGGRQSLTLRVVLQYVRLLLAGRRLRPIQGDPHQLGADFIIDADGILRLAHYSRDPTDRPRVADVMGLLRQLQEERRGPAGGAADAGRGVPRDRA